MPQIKHLHQIERVPLQYRVVCVKACYMSNGHREESKAIYCMVLCIPNQCGISSWVFADTACSHPIMCKLPVNGSCHHIQVHLLVQAVAGMPAHVADCDDALSRQSHPRDTIIFLLAVSQRREIAAMTFL